MSLIEKMSTVAIVSVLMAFLLPSMLTAYQYAKTSTETIGHSWSSQVASGLE